MAFLHTHQCMILVSCAIFDVSLEGGGVIVPIVVQGTQLSSNVSTGTGRGRFDASFDQDDDDVEICRSVR